MWAAHHGLAQAASNTVVCQGPLLGELAHLSVRDLTGTTGEGIDRLPAAYVGAPVGAAGAVFTWRAGARMPTLLQSSYQLVGGADHLLALAPDVSTSLAREAAATVTAVYLWGANDPTFAACELPPGDALLSSVRECRHTRQARCGALTANREVGQSHTLATVWGGPVGAAYVTARAASGYSGRGSLFSSATAARACHLRPALRDVTRTECVALCVQSSTTTTLDVLTWAWGR
jgi:hypothetical protein